MDPGFRKKLEKLGKQKYCELVSELQKSIINENATALS